VVYGRNNKGQVDEFGVSGYVYRNVFIIFDRRTESLWYPLDNEKWTAICGPRKGETIRFIAEPPVVTLGEWRKKHPNTLVLIGDRRQFELEKKQPAGKP